MFGNAYAETRFSEGLRNRHGRIRYQDHIVGNGAEVEARAPDLDVEGIVSKRVDAPYQEGRSQTWVKTKFWKDCELVVGGYIPSENSREAIGALLCGEMVGGELHYRCCVRSGYTEREKGRLFRMLKPRKTPAFAVPPSGWKYRDARWVRPSLVASVRYLDRTANGRLRMSTYRGLREDVECSPASIKKPLANLEPEHVLPEQHIVRASRTRISDCAGSVRRSH